MIAFIILGIIAIFFVALIIRTVLNKPKNLVSEEKKNTFDGLDKNLIANHLSEAIKIPTVTVINPSISEEPFFRYHEFLKNTYTEIFKIAEFSTVNKLSCVIKIDGADKSLLPIAILAHQDVVPAPKDGWEVEPFDGVIKDGYVYGRGAQDMKGQMIAALEAMEFLLKGGLKPKRGVYFCFGHDEENTGVLGAKKISEYLESQGIKFEYVLDEGGVVLDGKIIGVDGFLALIGTSEKGYMDVELKANVSGGHASTPSNKTAVALLCSAVAKLNKSPMKAYFSEPTKGMFTDLAPYMKPLFKFLFTNKDIFKPLIIKALSIASPLTNSLVRTTFAPTQLKGSSAPNVLGKEATCTVNCRINIGEDGEKALQHIKKVVGKNIEVSLLSKIYNPSPCSNIDSEAFDLLKNTIKQSFDKFIPAPYPFIAATDSKHYYNLSNNVYRFTPFMMSPDDQSRLHSLNERINIDNLKKGTEFFVNLFENSLK